MKQCPAKGKTCDECGRMNHLSSVCMTKDKRKTQQPKKLGRIVRTITGENKRPLVHVNINGQQIKALPDTGSDWDCISPKGLMKAQISENTVLKPTVEMRKTQTVTGMEIEPIGFVNAEISFGEKMVKKPLVVFEMQDDVLLSCDTLMELNIVQIKYESDSPSIRKVESSDRKQAMTIEPTKRQANGKTSSKEKIMKEYESVFKARKEPFGNEKYRIHLEPGTIPTRVSKCRHIPYAYMEKLQDELSKLEDEGIISKVTKPTEWVHPIVVAPKKNSEAIRLCIDFRNLNKHCQREVYSSPTVLETVQTINADKAKIFSKFDAKKGYHQCELDEESKDLTTFLTPFGRFRYERAPFGVNSIPEHYNRRMQEALENLPGVARVVDDILVYGATREEHDENVKKLLQRCQERNIRLNEEKFVYCQEEIEFAGVIINKDGFKANLDLMKAIAEFPEPCTAKEVRSFHGTVNQLSPYDSKLSQKLEPIRHLLKVKKGPIKLTEEESRAFEEVKKHLTSPETLAFYRPNQPLRIFTDAACTSGYGFVVQQQQPDGKWKPLLCNSRVLTEAEKNYSPIEAEMAALTWSLRKSEKFLKGQNVVVYTDHKPLIPIINKKRLDEVSNERLRSKLMYISDFNVTAEYVQGSENIAADTFSRKPVSKPDKEDLKESEDLVQRVRTIHMKAIEMSECDLQLQEIRTIADQDLIYQKLKKQIIEGFPERKSQLDENLAEYWNVREELFISDDQFIMKGNRLLIPKKLRPKILKEIHAGHRGREACKARARLVVYWPRIDHDIDVMCQSCEKCVYDRPSNPAEAEIHLPIPTRAFEIISADFAECDGLSFLIFTDWKSGWFSTRPVKNKDAKTAILELRNFIADTAVPRYLYTDNGQPFPSAEFQDFLRRWGIEWISSSPGYAQSNSYAENGVKSAKALLRKCITGKRIDYEEWDKGLLAIRNTPNKEGVSPAMILYGHMVKDTLPAHKRALQKSWHKQVSEVDKKLSTQRQRFETGKSLKPLKVGDPVVVQNRTSKRWDKYGVVQEVNVKTRKYMIRLQSGLMTVRNRIDLRRRYPPSNSGEKTASESQPMKDLHPPRYANVNNERLNNEDEESSDDDEEDEYQFIQPTNKEKRRPERRVRFADEEIRRSTRATKGQRPAYLKDYVQ